MSDRLFLSFLVKNVIVVFCIIFFWALNSFGAVSRWDDNGSLTIIIGKTDINQNVKVWCSDDLVWINGGDVKKANDDSVKCEEVKTLIIFGSYQANEVDLREMDKGGFRDDIEISVSFLENEGGNDKFFGSKYAEEVTGGAGNDTFFGNGGNDTLQGGLGHDYLSGGNGNDILEGGYHNDIINGGAGENDMVGGSGADRIDNWHGEGGVIYGDKDDDLIIPGNNTRVYSGTKRVNQSSDLGRIQSIEGGSDTIEFSAAGNRITIDLDLIDQWQIYDGNGRSLLFGDQFENLIGSPQADSITVDPLSKTRKLDGAKGYDTLHIDCKKKDVILTPTHILVDGYAPMRVVSFEVIDLQNAGTITRKKTAVTSTITPLLLFE